MRYSVLTIILPSLLVLSACGPQSPYADYQETDEGLRYKIHTTPGDTTAQVEDMLKIHKTTLTEDDSVVASTRNQGKPVEIIVAKDNQATPILTQLSKGDSITILEHTDSIIGSTPPENMPAYLRNNQYVKKAIKVLDIVPANKIKQQKSKKLTKQTKKDIKKIKQYLSEKGLEAQSTNSGIYYRVLKEGSGKAPTPGDKVTIHLKAQVMNGKEYYSTYKIGKPISITIGKNQLVPSLNEVCKLLTPKAKGTFYIPSPLAYGKEGSGDKVPPNSIIIFTVELVDIERGPKV